MSMSACYAPILLRQLTPSVCLLPKGVGTYSIRTEMDIPTKNARCSGGGGTGLAGTGGGGASRTR